MKPLNHPIKHVLRAIGRPLADSRGATAVEYGFILAMIVLAMFVALKGVANGTISLWNNVSTTVGNAR